MAIYLTILLLIVVALQAMAPIWLFLRHVPWYAHEEFGRRYQQKQWVTHAYPLVFFVFFCIAVGLVFTIARVTETATGPLVFYTYNLIVTMYGGFEIGTGVSIWPRQRRRERIVPAQFTAAEQVRWAGLTRVLLGLALFWGAFAYWSL